MLEKVSFEGVEVGSVIWKVTFLYLMWTIWREMDNCMFNCMELSTLELKSLYLQSLYEWWCTRFVCVHLPSLVGFVDYLSLSL